MTEVKKAGPAPRQPQSNPPKPTGDVDVGPYRAQLWHPGKMEGKSNPNAPVNGHPDHCSLCAKRAAPKTEV